MTVRDIRHHWPKAEKTLRTEQEILITRDSKPVAKLVRLAPARSRRKRFSAAEQAQWARKIHGSTSTQWVDKTLLAERNER